MAALLFLLWFLWKRYRQVSRRNRALLKEKEVIFGFVHDVGDVFAEDDAVDAEPLLERTLYYALRITRGGAGAAFMVEPGGGTLRVRAISGIFPPLAGRPDPQALRSGSKSRHVEDVVRTHPIRLGEGLVGEVAEFGGALLVEDADRDPRVPRYDEDFLRIRTLVAVPMRFRHRVMGVMVLVNRIDGSVFSQGDLDLLQALADQASVSVHYALLREELDAKRRMDHDLSIARRIQQMLLPRDVPHLAGLDLAAFNIPALEIGGDYYDFIRVDEHHLGIAIADVSGKGISGALLMSVCRSVLRAKAPGCLSPAAVLRAVNAVIVGDLREDMFITALYMILDTRTLDLTVARAGHEAPVLHRPARGPCARIRSPGIAIGLGGPEVFDAAVRDAEVRLIRGDSVTLFTDGISEARDERGEEWGVERLLETIAQGEGLSAGELLARVQDRVNRFSGGGTPGDDMTMVALRVLAAPTTVAAPPGS